jgi:hypothetical protein
MDRAMGILAGAGLGAGLMYFLDPDMGRRRRALARDKLVHVANEVEDGARLIVKDLENRAHGLAAGDLSVLVGGRRALSHPLRGGWSPSARSLMTLLGTGLFLFGLTRKAPEACVAGSVGLALAAEGVSNAGLQDIAGIPRKVACVAQDVASKFSPQGRQSITEA